MKTFLTSNRAKSFYWRFGAMVVAYILANISSLGLSNEIVVIAGLVLGECSKAMNTYITQNKL